MQPPSLFAVIVTYHPDADFRSNLEAILPQVTGVIVVDNGGVLPDLPERIFLIQNPENIGLAAAQNQGIAAALQKGAQWVLLLDDDSVPAPDMVAQMWAAYAANPRHDAIGLIAPRVHDRQIDTTYRIITGSKWRFQTTRRHERYVNHLLFAIASGSLIKREVFDTIGLMRDAFFIDHIDTEFCARMLAHGYAMMSAGDAMLYHALGNSAREDGIVRKHYPPERYYTQFRNLLWVVRLYGLKLPAYAALNLGSGLREFCRVVLYEKQKLPKLCAIGKGICKGLFYPMGGA